MLLFAESFDGYGGTVAHMANWPASPVLSSTYKRNGTHSATVANNVQLRNITTTAATTILGAAFLDPTTNWSSNWNLFGIGSVSGSSTGTQWTVRANNDRSVSFMRNGITQIGASGPVLIPGIWNFVEVKVFIHPSVGTFEIRVNGVMVVDNTSVNTQGQATNAIATFQYGDVANNSNVFMDDLHVLDNSSAVNNDFIGDNIVECLFPQTGNGSNVGWTPSTGTDHGAMVDEAPADDDTTYNSATTVSLKDSYNFTNLVSTGIVRAVQVTGRMRKTDTATKQVAFITRVGGTDYDGAAKLIAGTSYSSIYQDTWERNPNTGALWTPTEVNAAEFGVKILV